jgi:transaldolase
MERQAREISSWGSNVYVKIPCTLTDGRSTGLLVSKLGKRGVKVNVTAVMTLQQIGEMCRFIWVGTPAILSIFCGRIADTGRDPIPFITKALQQKHDKTQILWASTREVLNVKQAEAAGADIITLSPDLIRKLDLFGKDLAQYSLETVKQFFEDGKGIEF